MHINLSNLENRILKRLERQASKNGRTVEEEVHEILHASLSSEPLDNFIALAAKLRESTSYKQTPSEVLLREGRNER